MTYKKKKLYYFYLKSESPQEFFYVMKWLFLGAFLLMAGMYSTLVVASLFQSAVLIKLTTASLPISAAVLYYLLLHLYESYETPRLQEYSRIQRYKIKRAIKIQKKTNPIFNLYCISMTALISFLTF